MKKKVLGVRTALEAIGVIGLPLCLMTGLGATAEDEVVFMLPSSGKRQSLPSTTIGTELRHRP